jgi:hypothetical protein
MMGKTTAARSGGAILAAALGLLLLGAPGMGQETGAAAAAGKAPEAGGRPCRYTNPQYAGVCLVQRAKGETCASILAYLNDPRSQGKSYCGNTSIRGGWARSKGTPKSPAPSPSPTAR